MYYFRAWRRRGANDNLGYSLSRLEVDSEYCDSETSNSVKDENSSPNKPANLLDHEVAQLTKLRSAPHENLSHIHPGKREYPVSTVKMLAGRECNYSGRGRFSSSDHCHVLSRYLPVNSPCVVDQMTTRAYVSQFSADGSLCVVAYQVLFTFYHEKLKYLWKFKSYGSIRYVKFFSLPLYFFKLDNLPIPKPNSRVTSCFSNFDLDVLDFIVF